MSIKVFLKRIEQREVEEAQLDDLGHFLVITFFYFADLINNIHSEEPPDLKGGTGRIWRKVAQRNSSVE